MGEKAVVGGSCLLGAGYNVGVCARVSVCGDVRWWSWWCGTRVEVTCVEGSNARRRRSLWLHHPRHEENPSRHNAYSLFKLVVGWRPPACVHHRLRVVVCACITTDQKQH
jgi:hypothetical protein